MTRVLILTPDLDWPIGGVKVHYQVVDALNANGIDAAVVHARNGFRCSWFQNQTKIIARRAIELCSSDLVVVPEEWAHLMDELPTQVAKIIFNQNAYTTFGWGASWQEVAKAYARPDVVRVVAISDNNAAYIRYAFPRVEVRRARQVLDFERFRPDWRKRRIISYMPRKRSAESAEVISLLKSRNALQGWEILPIDRMTEIQTAEILRSSAIFLSFSHREGCPLPPAEAMACGCIVIGFHGWGGAEISDEACWVADGDVVACARKIEEVAGSWDDPAWRDRAIRVAAHVRRNYDQPTFDASVIAAFECSRNTSQSVLCGRISQRFWRGERTKGSVRMRHAVGHMRSAARVLIKGG